MKRFLPLLVLTAALAVPATASARTGRYRNARGTMRLRSRANGTKYDFIFRLR